jgi:hypothetical protein
MKWCCLVVAACASAPPPSPLTGWDVSVSLVEWRAHAADAEHVALELVVDGGVTKLGTIDGTPESCAIGSAAPKQTELVCGNEAFVAEVAPGELVVTEVIGAQRRDSARIPIGPSVAINVAPLRLPGSSDR